MIMGQVCRCETCFTSLHYSLLYGSDYWYNRMQNRHIVIRTLSTPLLSLHEASLVAHTTPCTVVITANLRLGPTKWHLGSMLPESCISHSWNMPIKATRWQAGRGLAHELRWGLLGNIWLLAIYVGTSCPRVRVLLR